MPGIDECLSEAMAMPGALVAGLVDWTSGLALGALGGADPQEHEAAAADAAEVVRAVAESPTFTAAGPGAAGPEAPLEDAIVTSAAAYHLVRFVDTAFDSRLFLYVRLDRATANLALARMVLRDLAERLVLA
ncbi:hypothetical protein [Streptomyces thermolineatus]|uniref:hypothetical protein n=1 Tax=Streptomyces thermolineatus TaxID=44033 RepID=UPI0038517FB7